MSESTTAENVKELSDEIVTALMAAIDGNVDALNCVRQKYLHVDKVRRSIDDLCVCTLFAALAKNRVRLAALEAQDARREAEVKAFMTAWTHVGGWDGISQYRQFNFVSYRGSLWQALRNNIAERPNDPNATTNRAWRLVCRAGRDGRDRDAREAA